MKLTRPWCCMDNICPRVWGQGWSLVELECWAEDKGKTSCVDPASPARKWLMKAYVLAQYRISWTPFSGLELRWTAFAGEWHLKLPWVAQGGQQWGYHPQLYFRGVGREFCLSLGLSNSRTGWVLGSGP